jgi:hypothetical protein
MNENSDIAGCEAHLNAKEDDMLRFGEKNGQDQNRQCATII